MKLKNVVVVLGFSIFMNGCGGGGGGSPVSGVAAPSVGLNASNANQSMSIVNASLTGIGNTANSWNVSAPKASISKISTTADPKLIQVMKSIQKLETEDNAFPIKASISNSVSSVDSQGYYTISETFGGANPSSFTYRVRFLDGAGSPITGSDVSLATKIELVVNGYETEKNSRIDYTDLAIILADAGVSGLNVNGSGQIRIDSGLPIVITISNALFNYASGNFESGKVRLASTPQNSSTTNQTEIVAIEATYNANGAPTFKIEENSSVLSSGTLTPTVITLGDKSATFGVNSANITHPIYGDMFNGKARIYRGSLSAKSVSVPINVTLQKSSSTVQICDIQARKGYLVGASSQGAVGLEIYFAQDIEGNLWQLGQTNTSGQVYLIDCQSASLTFPKASLMNNGYSWKTKEFETTGTIDTQITGVGISYSGFTNLTRMKNISTSLNSTSYWNQTYGLCAEEGTFNIDGISGTYSAQRIFQ